MKVIAYVPELNRETEVEIPSNAMYWIYREMEFFYRIIDAENHVEYAGYDPSDFTNADYKKMARLFAKRCDCNIDENSMWAAVVDEYVKDKGVA